MTEMEIRTEILDIRSGELIDPADTPKIADLLLYLRELRARITVGVAACTQAIVAEAERQGTKTLHVGGTKLEVKGGTEIIWDVEELRTLLDVGLPEERFNLLVTETVTYKVNGNVAKAIAGANPEYAKIIERARTDFDKARYVSVK